MINQDNLWLNTRHPANAPPPLLTKKKRKTKKQKQNTTNLEYLQLERNVYTINKWGTIKWALISSKSK